jgi:phosphotransferase system HPr (HPr) family protein
MPDADATRIVVVANQAGVHARAAVMIATAARQFVAKVVIVKGLSKVEATDVLQLLSLGAMQGEQLVLEATGNDAVGALEALENLFLRKFDED